MRKFEKIITLLVLISLIFKFIDIPGGGVLFVLVSSVLSIYYFIFTFALLNNLELKHLFVSSSYSKISSLRTIGTIGLGIGLSLAVVAVMFIVQHWSGGLPNLVSSIIILLLISIVALIKRKQCIEKFFYNNVLLRVGIWLSGGIVAYLIVDV